MDSYNLDGSEDNHPFVSFGSSSSSIPDATLATIRKALPWLVAGSAGVLAVVALCTLIVYSTRMDKSATPTTLAVPTTTPYTQLRVGQACTSSVQCIASAYCDSTSNLCACSAQLYLNSATGKCESRKLYGASCATSGECEYFAFLSCINSVCKCEPATFYYDSVNAKCADYVGLGMPCTSTSQCFASTMVCDYYAGGTTKICACQSLAYYYSFQTGVCQLRNGHGSACTVSGGSHFECVDNAWCTTTLTDSTAKCYCFPDHYWDSVNYACTAKKQYGQSCSQTYHCLDYQGQACVGNFCGCPTGTFWNKTNCDPKKPYGGICNMTSDCLYAGLVCAWRPEQQNYGCMCPNGTYYLLANNSCVNFLNIGQVCIDNYQCPLNSTCTLQSGSSNKVCTCAQYLYYRVAGTNQCAILKNFSSSCTSSAECYSLSGLVCTNGQCVCSTNYYYNGQECEVQKGYEAATTFSVFCLNEYECKTSQSLTNCYRGACLCKAPKTWNAVAYQCQ